MKRRMIIWKVLLMAVLLLCALAFVQWQHDSYQHGYDTTMHTLNAQRDQAYTEGFSTLYVQQTQTAEQP